MPNVVSSGTYTKSDAGFDGLAETDRARSIRFTGTSIGTQCTINVKDDAGVFDSLSSSVVTGVNVDSYIQTMSELNLVFTGSPNCNVTIEYLDV